MATFGVAAPAKQSPHSSRSGSDTGDSDEADQESASRSDDGGLAVVWTSPDQLEDIDKDRVKIDFVVARGISRNDYSDAWLDTKAGSWLTTAITSDWDYRVIEFRYDPSDILCGSQSAAAIRKIASRLLGSLKQLREGDDAKRSIMFLGQDIGAIIVKAALVTAFTHQGEWVDILDHSRILLFSDCPHRCYDRPVLQEKLGRFLFHTATFPDSPPFQSIASSIPGLASAIAEINGAFITSKIHLRSHLISTYLEQTHLEEARFDMRDYTIGVPFERRFSRNIAIKYRDQVSRHIEQLDFVPFDQTISQERALIRASSSIQPLTSSFAEDFWLKGVTSYETWLNSRTPQLIHLRGSTGDEAKNRYLTEQAFYHLEDDNRKRNISTPVLYFDFKPRGSKARSLSDMLFTLIAQLICHYPNMQDDVAPFYLHLGQQRGCTDVDLMRALENFITTEPVDDMQLIIHQLDQCDASSRKVFLDSVSRHSAMLETPWKVLVTSCTGLDTELSEWLRIDIHDDGGAPSMAAQDSSRLVNWHRFYRFGDGMEHRLALLEDLDPVAHSIVWHQLWTRHNDPEGAMDFLRVALEPLNDPTLDKPAVDILNRVLRYLPDQRATQRGLRWLRNSTRPLSMRELVTIMFTKNDDDNEDRTEPTSVDILVCRVESWFAGIIDIENDEVHIRYAELKEIFETPKREGAPAYIWHDNNGNTQLALAMDCARYISKWCGQNSGAAFTFLETCGPFPLFLEHGIFLPYAVQFWFQHLIQGSSSTDPAALSNGLQHVDLTVWSKLYWALSSPTMRSQVQGESLFPLLASWGYLDVVKSSGQEDLDTALKETALHGRVSVVKDLLKQGHFSQSVILDAIRSAAASGKQHLVLELMDHLSDDSKRKVGEWGPELLFRASRLDCDKLAEALLSLGCPCDPVMENRLGANMTPLWLCSLSGSSSTAKVLIDHGADIEFLGLFDRTPLVCAARLGHANIIALLAAAGANLEHRSDHQTALYHATLWGNIQVVEELLRLGVDPNPRTEKGWTPIVCAADDGYNRSIEALLRSGANVDTPGPDGTDTALRYAAVRGDVECSRLLLDNGAEPNNPLIQPPILVEMLSSLRVHDDPSGRKKLEMTNLLLEYGADINAADDGGDTALKSAVRIGDVELVRSILDREPDINQTDKEGRTALYEATVKQNTDLVRLLLDKGANANIPVALGWLPLHVASSNSEITRLLAEKTANVDTFSPQGLTQLMLASSKGWPDCVQVLIENKADVNAMVPLSGRVWPGWIPINFAAMFNHDEIVTLLAEAGSNVNHRTPEGVAPLMAARGGRALPALLQFRSSLDINQVGAARQTALHYAKTMPFENVQCLIRGGININHQDKYGHTALCMAVQNNRHDTVTYMLKHSADPNLPGVSAGGLTAPPLHHACRGHKLDLVKMLTDHSADVNYLAADMCGTPLIATCLQFAGNENQCGPEIMQHLLNLGANVNAESHDFGSPLNAAAWCMGPDSVRFLLENGATVDKEDCIGRRPIHFAAFRGGDNFTIVLEAGSDINTRDKLGRSALHWAAQTGRVQIVRRTLDMMPPGAVNDADVDGWTPLCWAVRGVKCALNEGFAGEVADQIGVVKLLLERGAQRSVECTLVENKWTVLQLARYCEAEHAILELLEYGVQGRSSESTEDVPGDSLPENRKLHYQGQYCKSCFWRICGRKYQCETCYEFNLCDKCYAHREITHGAFPDHALKEVGPEFDEVSESGSTLDDDSSSGSSSVSTSSHHERDDQDGEADEEGAYGTAGETNTAEVGREVEDSASEAGDI